MPELVAHRDGIGLWQPKSGNFWGLMWLGGNLELRLARAAFWIGIHRRLKFGVTTYAVPRQHIYDIGPLRLAWAWHGRRRSHA